MHTVWLGRSSINHTFVVISTQDNMAPKETPLSAVSLFVLWPQNESHECQTYIVCMSVLRCLEAYVYGLWTVGLEHQAIVRKTLVS